MSSDATKRFMSIDYTTTMKGICCIIVILVHVPPAYQNRLQDAIGSFAFISVTMFMLFSGYGIAYGIEHKKNFFSNFSVFLKRRLLAVFLPFIISVAIKWIFGFNPLSGGTGYVKVILLFYIVTYVSHKVTKKFEGGIWKWLSITAIICYSIMGRFGITLGWYVEALGFAYGMLLGGWMKKLTYSLPKRRWHTLALLTLVSGILGVMYLRYKLVPVLGDYILKIALGIALICLGLLATANFSPKNKASTWLGTHSFEIYLYHGFVMSAIDWLNQKNGLRIRSGLFIVLAFTLTFLIAIPMHTIDNKIINKIREL